MDRYYAFHFVDGEIEAQEGGCLKVFSKARDETQVINQVPGSLISHLASSVFL